MRCCYIFKDDFKMKTRQNASSWERHISTASSKKWHNLELEKTLFDILLLLMAVKEIFFLHR